MQSDKELIEALEGYANDPMWADHAEVPRRLLRQAIARLRALTAEPDEAGSWKGQAQQAASVIRMIRAMIGEMFGPIANIESEEATLLRGPEAKYDGEAILEALQRVEAALAAVPRREGWRPETIRICVMRDGPCPHGMNCPYASDGPYGYPCKDGWRTPAAPQEGE